MYNDYMYAIDRSDEYLEHYGIKGMKWGVRKAIERGGTGLGNRRLARQYRKAQKKLAKLEKRANNGDKYARRAARLGAGAALTGGLALAGTGRVGSALSGIGGRITGSKRLQDAFTRAATSSNGTVARLGTAATRGIYGAGDATRRAGEAVTRFGNTNYSHAFDTAATKALKGQKSALERQALRVGSRQIQNGNVGKAAKTAANYTSKAAEYDKAIANSKKVVNASGNQLARAGLGAAALGLAGAAAYNQYRAGHTQKARQQAEQFRKEMNKTFAGTAYGKQGGSKKRRRR